MASGKFLTDEQWAVLRPLIPPPARRADGRGRSIEHDDRAVMDGILWVLRTGAPGPICPPGIRRMPHAISGSLAESGTARWSGC